MRKPQAPKVAKADMEALARSMDPGAMQALTKAVRIWAKVKRSGGKVVVATGSGPNLHEGVTTLLAELIRMGLVDGVLTSSAVICHEMAGALERVRRVDGAAAGLKPEALPIDGKAEAAVADPELLKKIAGQAPVDLERHARLLALPGKDIIKVAGNLAYPTGLWAEHMASRMLPLAQKRGLPLEAAVGPGCDRLTMLGASARRKTPCLVTVPQLVGGGAVGLAVGDSISVSRRSARVAALLARADLIVESGLALAQEIHDGPYETYTGHGLWAEFRGEPTFSLGGKAVVRIDLDPQLRRAWELERKKGAVASAIDQGRPKAAGLGMAFRMEMSGFARLPGSLPIQGDLGVVWPLLASRVARALGVSPGFMCYKQGTKTGEAVREYIVNKVRPFDVEAAEKALREGKTWR